MIGGNLPSVSIVSQNEESEQYAALRCYKKMKPYLLLLCSGASLMFCSCSLVNPVGDWPLRTKDPSLSVVSNHFKLSDHDIQEIHQAVWSEFPEFRVLGIETIKADVVLITCTKQKGEKFSKLYGLDSKKSGGKWTLGNYRSNMSANNM